MERCVYCGTPFIKSESCDIGVSSMQVTDGEPNCDCYEIAECFACGLASNKGELERHYCGNYKEESV